MKSSALQITSAAVNVAGAPEQDSAVDTAAFEAMLVPQLCKPIVEALGPLGSALGDVLARAVLERAQGDQG